MTIREQQEKREHEVLSRYAAFSDQSTGRDRPEEQCDLRTVYQRDRDRILHCKAFRRLKHKTQVFLSPGDDHYRTRLTHTLEVAQIARTIARSLRLNEDLTEAIALGHDLGHTPFGHVGERTLAACAGNNFSHNVQSVRVVERLENRGEGLNLTWEVRDGMLNHKTSCTPHTLEGQCVRLADKIAYVNHDIDDAIRGNILKEEDLPKIMEEYDKLAVEYIKRKKEGRGFNFFHFMIDLNQGPCVAKRLSGCGSGTEYLAVTPWGDFYPCHQFVGQEDFLMGNVDTGITRTDIRDEFKLCNVYAKEKCRDCFARFYCSGGCAANSYNFHGTITDAYEIGCEMQKKRIECAIMIKAALADEE